MMSPGIISARMSGRGIGESVMWIINVFVRALLRLLRIRGASGQGAQPLSMAELRTLVLEGGKFIPKKHQSIFLNLFELEDMTVDDTMTPRGQIEYIDLGDDIEEVRSKLATAHHTRLVVCEGGLDNAIGILHVRKVLNATRREQIDIDGLREISRDTYFVPSGTPLNTQLLNFQRDRRRVAFVVDEYGDIQGLITIDDILEEIVGEFTTDPATMMHKDVHRDADGSFVVNATTTVRALNRSMRWSLPTDGPKTLNGLIVEFLETIPEPGTTLKLQDYMLEVLQTGDNAIKTVRIRPPDAIVG